MLYGHSINLWLGRHLNKRKRITLRTTEKWNHTVKTKDSSMAWRMQCLKTLVLLSINKLISGNIAS